MQHLTTRGMLFSSTIMHTQSVTNQRHDFTLYTMSDSFSSKLAFVREGLPGHLLHQVKPFREAVKKVQARSNSGIPRWSLAGRYPILDMRGNGVLALVDPELLGIDGVQAAPFRCWKYCYLFALT